LRANHESRKLAAPNVTVTEARYEHVHYSIPPPKALSLARQVALLVLCLIKPKFTILKVSTTMVVVGLKQLVTNVAWI